MRELQATLTKLGFDTKGIDGIAGPNTAVAFEKFLKSNGIKFDVSFTPSSLTATGPYDQSELPWLQEAKRVMGKHEARDNSFLKKWLKSDGKTLGDPAKLPWCFTGETQILTEDGWQRLDNLKALRVYQVDESGGMSLTPYFPVEKEYSGEVFQVKHRSFSLVCDPEHRWWGTWNTTRQGKGEAPRFGTLGRINGKGVNIPLSFSTSNGSGLQKQDLTMVAAILSDGSVRKNRDEIVFEVSKDRKIKALQALNPKHHYTQKRVYGELTVVPLDVFTFSTPHWYSAVITDEKELDRDFINSLSRGEAQEFLLAYGKFDGNDGKRDRLHLYTSSEQRCDDLVTIITLAGWGSGVSEKTSPLSARPCYEIHVGRSSTSRHIDRKNLSTSDFSGKLYCVQVPQGRIVVRERGKGAVVTGNCGDFVETCIRLALPAEPFPKRLGENPYLARNWLHLGQPCEPSLGSIGVFWRGKKEGTSGHVGFLIGEDDANFYVLGGNQSNSVSITRLDRGRLLGARWPVSFASIPARLPAMSPSTIPRTFNEV